MGSDTRCDSQGKGLGQTFLNFVSACNAKLSFDVLVTYFAHGLPQMSLDIVNGIINHNTYTYKQAFN